MNYYILSSLIAFILLGMGLFALFSGSEIFFGNKESKSGLEMFIVCICIFFWDAGYAWMSISYESDFAYIPRAIALLAVFLYTVFIIRYVAIVLNYNKKDLKIILVAICALAVISWPQIITKKAVTFEMTPWGYWYYSKMSLARIMQFLSVLLGMVEYYKIMAYGMKNAGSKREKYVIKRFCTFGPILFVGYFLDTLIPSIFHIPAVPGSSIAAFASSMIILHISRVNRVFGLSKENVSQYVFEDVNIPVIITGNDRRIVLCNNSTLTYLNCSLTDIRNHSIHEFFSETPEDYYIVNGSNRECTLDKTVIKDNYGEPIYSIYFVRDITEERINFRLMQKSKEDAEEANRAKSDFLANMSHEIRTPMNAIIGMSQIVLESGELSDDVTAQVNEIKIAGTNLLGIINDILDMSKIEAGKYELVVEPYELPGFIHEISSLINARLSDSSVKFILDIDPTLPKVLIGDELRIRQILMNILGNAIKFTEKGSITFKVTWNHYEKAPDILYDITDTGIGIRPEDKETIFGKFDQVDIKRNKNIKGTGLGLAISRNLAILMGGYVTVESEYGKGSTFHIVMCQEVSEYEPIGEKVANELNSNKYIAPVETTSVVEMKTGASVLVVDDSKVNLMVATGLLKKYGMEIDVASSGQESIEKVQKKDYNIVFMDQMMPEMDGIEALKRIRALGGKYESLHIVALTANALKETRNFLINEGFDDYITKPINGDELNRVIQQWV